MTDRDDARVAVLFDMDGLLVDSEPLWLEAETAVMARLGADWTAEDQVQLLGGSLDRTVRYLMGKARRPASPGQVAEWLMSGVVELVRDHGVPLRPGARELLAEVAAAGLPHALVTASERRFMDVVLARTGLRFDALVCADDVSVTKPDPEPYLLAAKLLGADPARCYRPGGLAERRGLRRGRRVPGHRGPVAGPDRARARPGRRPLAERAPGHRRRHRGAGRGMTP